MPNRRALAKQAPRGFIFWHRIWERTIAEQAPDLVQHQSSPGDHSSTKALHAQYRFHVPPSRARVVLHKIRSCRRVAAKFHAHQDLEPALATLHQWVRRRAPRSAGRLSGTVAGLAAMRPPRSSATRYLIILPLVTSFLGPRFPTPRYPRMRTPWRTRGAPRRRDSLPRHILGDRKIRGVLAPCSSRPCGCRSRGNVCERLADLQTL